MKIATASIVVMLAFSVVPALVGGTQVHGDDGAHKTIGKWGVSQAVDPSDEGHRTLSDTRANICDGNEHSPACTIGGPAIDGATLRIAAVGVSGTLGPARAVSSILG